jgi:hypothetical protein
VKSSRNGRKPERAKQTPSSPNDLLHCNKQHGLQAAASPGLRNFLPYTIFCIASNIEKSLTYFVLKTVLIADDSASMRLSVRLLLEGRHPELSVRELLME